MVNELNKIMEYIRDTKNPVKEDFISAATNHLMNFFNHKGLTYGLIGTGVSALLYKLCQNKWICDMLKMMYNGTVNTIITIGNGIVNTGKAIKHATVRTIDWTTGYFSDLAQRKREEDDQTALYALNLKNKLHALIREYNTNQGMILRNLDYLVYHNDWQGVIQLCNDQYENSQTELKECIANLYNFSHEAKLLCQNTDYYGNMVDPRLINFMTDNRFNSLDEIAERYNIDIKNITWSKPDKSLYYSVMKEHFQISDDLLDTRYVNNKGWFKPMYELISEDVAYTHNLTSPEQYEIARNPKGVIERLKEDLRNVQSKLKEYEERRLESEKEKEKEEKTVEEEKEKEENNEEENKEEEKEEEEYLTLEEALEQHKNRDVKAIRFEHEMQPSNHFEYINNRVTQNYANPIHIENNLELPQVNPNMTLGNAADTNNGALTAIIVSAVLGVLGYFYKRNYDSENTQTLPTQQTNPTLPETNHNYNVYKPRNDSRKAVVEINTDDNTDDNKKSSKSLFQSISDYFWPKGTT